MARCGTARPARRCRASSSRCSTRAGAWYREQFQMRTVCIAPAPTTGANAVSTLRIGFRPRTVPYDGGARLDLTMTPIPPLLEPVTVRAATNCPARSDRLQALSLLQQARAGLLATVTARKTNRAALVRLRYLRHYDARGRRDCRTARDSRLGGRARARLSARCAVARSSWPRGLPIGERLAVPIHYGPDAETLLDDDFAAGYCFQISDPDAARPTEIGLGFKPSSRKNGRVDIQGTLWIDTVSKALHDIQFDYVGDDRPFGAPQTGGHIQFRQMGNGIVIIDRWALRLWTARPRNQSVDAHGSPIVRPSVLRPGSGRRSRDGDVGGWLQLGRVARIAARARRRLSQSDRSERRRATARYRLSREPECARHRRDSTSVARPVHRPRDRRGTSAPRHHAADVVVVRGGA